MVLVEQNEPVVLENPTMDQIREMVLNPDAEVTPKADPEPKQPEGTGEVEEEKLEPEAKPLPKGVQKRLDEEKALQADYDRQIAEAVSARKAKEAELAKLTTDTGTAPVKTGDKVDPDARPVKPNFATFEGTGDEFDKALEDYEKNLESWLEGRTKKTVEAQFQEREAIKAAQARWDSAVKEHGDKWESAAKAISETAPESMQDAISALDNWSKMAVHLAANPAELTALAEQFKAHPPGSPGFFKAVAQLGRLEEKITAAPAVTAPKPKAKVVTLPPPISDVDAATEEGNGEFDYEAATPAQRRAHLVKGGLLG